MNKEERRRDSEKLKGAKSLRAMTRIPSSRLSENRLVGYILSTSNAIARNASHSSQ